MGHDVLFKSLLACNLISSISLAIIAPFFPPFAKQRGISENVIGIIFSAHPLGASIAAFILGKIISNENRYIIMSLGLIVQGMSMFSFMVLQFIDGQFVTIILSTLARFMNGVGSALFFTPFYATVPYLFPLQVDSKIAISAFINSLGYMVGPVFGSLLYSIGGFSGPFLFFGIACFIMAYALTLQNRQQKNQNNLLLNNQIQESHNLEININYIDFLVKFEIFILVGITFICNILYTYYSPIIANYYFETFNIAPEEVGYYMIGGATGYAFSAFIIYKFPMNKDFKILYLFLGLLVTGLVQFFYGPDSITGLRHNIYISVGAQFICGFTVLFPYVLQLSYLNKFLNQFFILGDYTSGAASALFNIAASCGELTGPLISGYLVQKVGFERTASCLGFGILIMVILTIPMIQRELEAKNINTPKLIELTIQKIQHESEQLQTDDRLY